MQQVTFNGVTAPVLAIEKLGLAEVSAVEKVTGLTLPRIRRMGGQCVCDHGVDEHVRYDKDDKVTDDLSCKVCKKKCPAFEADIPTEIRTAFIWVSLKRAEPTVTFKAVADAVGEDAPQISFTDDEVVEDEDPTQADPQEELPT